MTLGPIYKLDFSIGVLLTSILCSFTDCPTVADDNCKWKLFFLERYWQSFFSFYFIRFLGYDVSVVVLVIVLYTTIQK